PPQIFGLAAGKSRRDHGHAQQLLLKQRHAEGARENRLERRMRIPHRLAAGAAVQIRMDHLPDDGPGPDNRHLDDDVVEAGRLEARERRHLRARFHLEDADRVGLLEQAVHRRVVRQMSQIDFSYLAWGPTIIYSRRGPTPGAVAQRVRASQRLKAVTPWQNFALPRPRA